MSRRKRHEVTPDELTAARARLLLHRREATSASCVACGRPSPCATSQDAAQVLADAGAWNTLATPASFAPTSGEPTLTDPGEPTTSRCRTAVTARTLRLLRLLRSSGR